MVVMVLLSAWCACEIRDNDKNFTTCQIGHRQQIHESTYKNRTVWYIWAPLNYPIEKKRKRGKKQKIPRLSIQKLEISLIKANLHKVYDLLGSSLQSTTVKKSFWNRSVMRVRQQFLFCVVSNIGLCCSTCIDAHDFSRPEKLATSCEAAQALDSSFS